MSFPSEPSSKTLRLLALSMLKGVGATTLRKVARIPGFEKRPVDELAGNLPLLKKALVPSDAWATAEVAAAGQVAQAATHEATILSIADPGYPALLARTNDDPVILYVKGQLTRPGLSPLAVIGTRQPTSHGTVITQRLVEHLVRERWSIVSGLALGCDALAHQAAIDAGGHTVAVLAHGLQTVAPTANRRLAEDILASGGALVSEFPFGAQPIAQLFVQRDKTQAGLSHGVVMVQSDIKGGSLHASRAAIGYGRWLAVPYPTPPDLAVQAPKVQANLVLADGTDPEKADLLRCPVSALSRLIVLRSREDYARIPAPDDLPVGSAGDAQAGLL